VRDNRAVDTVPRTRARNPVATSARLLLPSTQEPMCKNTASASHVARRVCCLEMTVLPYRNFRMMAALCISHAQQVITVSPGLSRYCDVLC
jgi:hypothetical protein